MEPTTSSTEPPTSSTGVGGVTPPTSTSEVAIPFEARREEDALSKEFQHDLALVVTPVAVCLVVGVWVTNLRKGRVAAAHVDGLLAAAKGALEARRAKKQGAPNGTEG